MSERVLILMMRLLPTFLFSDCHSQGTSITSSRCRDCVRRQPMIRFVRMKADGHLAFKEGNGESGHGKVKGELFRASFAQSAHHS